MKSIFIKSVLILLLSFIFSEASDLEDIKKRGELRHIGVLYANFITGSGDGLDMDLMKGFSKYLNVEYKFVQSTWKDIFTDLTGENKKKHNNKTLIKGDIIANGLTILNWRKKLVDFSTPTFPSGVWVIARIRSSITPIIPTDSILKDIKVVKKSLSGKSILGVENTCLDPKLYKLKETSKANIKIVNEIINPNELVPLIIDNHAETTLLDVPDALIALEKWPSEIKVIGPVSEKQEMAVAVRKDSDLLKEFNNYFEEIKQNGEYNKLVKKYYPDVFYYYPDFFK